MSLESPSLYSLLEGPWERVALARRAECAGHLPQWPFPLLLALQLGGASAFWGAPRNLGVLSRILQVPLI